VAKVDPSVFEPFRPEHGSSSFVKTVHLCTKYLRTWSCTLAECRLLSSDGTKKCIVFLAVSRPTFLVSVSGLSQSHLPCLQQNLFSDPTPWTAKTEMYSLPVFLRQLVTRSCSTATFWQTPWSQQTRWTLLELSTIIPKWTAISLTSQSLRLFWFLNHFRLSALPCKAFFLTVCSKPPANPADCYDTDLTGMTDWLTDPDDWSGGSIEAVTRSTMSDKLPCHRNCHRCYPFLRQTIVLKCQKVKICGRDIAV